MILTYNLLGAANKFSEHLTIKCKTDFNVEYFKSVGQAKSVVTPKLAWVMVNDGDINRVA